MVSVVVLMSFVKPAVGTSYSTSSSLRHHCVCSDGAIEIRFAKKRKRHAEPADQTRRDEESAERQQTAHRRAQRIFAG